MSRFYFYPQKERAYRTVISHVHFITKGKEENPYALERKGLLGKLTKGHLSLNPASIQNAKRMLMAGFSTGSLFLPYRLLK